MLYLVRRAGLVSVWLLPAVFLLLVLFDGVRLHPDTYAGLPRAQQIRPWPWDKTWFHVLDSPGYVLGYSERWRLPLWVGYRLDEPQVQKPASRPRHFTVDRRSFVRVDQDDYRHSGFDRGHMAPNYAMSRFHGRAAQVASFRMSNIVPQAPALNQKLWQRLEELEADVFAALPGPLWVLMGPVFNSEPKRLASGVAVPDGFFRIWLRETPAGPQVLAFLIPQQVSGYEGLDNFLASVDEIEQRTRLDFFHHLADPQEEALERALRPEAWRFSRYAKRPPRYN